MPDLPEQGTDTSSSASGTPGGERSSQPDGRESPSTTTYETWALQMDESTHTEVELSPTLRKPSHGAHQPLIFVSEKESDDGSLTPWLPQRGRIHDADGVHPTLQGGKSGDRGFNIPNVLISSAEDSPARTSPSPASAPVSQASAPASSSSSLESSTLFDPDGYSSRTYPASSLHKAVGTSESSLERWPSSGMAWDGAFSTAVSSECRSADAVCSSSEPSLTEILQPPHDVPARYSLSARAAEGILRRAQKRGRTLPSHLSAALEAVARTTTTDRQTA